MTEPGRHAALVGATASGKSALALELVRADPSWEIVTADSMQVYRGMDIGTAKPTAAEQAEAPHHLIDLLDPCEEASVAWYQREARRVLADVEHRDRRALLVGGTALWVQAVVDDLALPGRYPEARAAIDHEADTGALHRRLVDLDPTAAGRMEPSNRRRIVRALEVTLGSGRPFSSYGPGLDAHPESPIRLVGLHVEPEELTRRIERRYAAQLDAGFLDEVGRLRDDPRGSSRTAAQALGYRELRAHLDGETSLDDALQAAIARTRRFARRQRAWFRRDPRITWIAAGGRSARDGGAVNELAARLRRGDG